MGSRKPQLFILWFRKYTITSSQTWACIQYKLRKLPPGHPEGIFDAMGNIYHGVANAIAKKTVEGSYPDLNDGVRGMQFIEAVVQSHQLGNTWIEIE